MDGCALHFSISAVFTLTRSRQQRGSKACSRTALQRPSQAHSPERRVCKSRVTNLKEDRQEIKSQTNNLVKGHLERLMGGSEYREQSRELHVSKRGLVELQQMTANPVRGSRAAALERSAPYGPLIKSSTWKLSQPTLWSLVVLK